jgi:hypothetical protein
MSLQRIATCLTIAVNRNIGWQQTTTNKDAADTVVASTGAVAGRVSVKTVLLDLPVCGAISLLYTQIGEKLKTMGTPLGGGKYLVPASYVAEVKQYLDDCKAKLEVLKTSLEADYAAFLATQEQTDLGTLFDRRNYADVSTVLCRTQIKATYELITESSRFSSMFTDAALIAELEADNNEKLSKAADDAATDLWNTFLDRVIKTRGIVGRYLQNQAKGKRLDAVALCERLKTTALNIDRLNNAMFLTPDPKLSGAISKVLAAVPANPLALKEAAVGSAFVGALGVAIGSSLPPDDVHADSEPLDDADDADDVDIDFAPPAPVRAPEQALAFDFDEF